MAKNKPPVPPPSTNADTRGRNDAASADAGQLPPQSADLLAGQALLGKVVRASVGGHMETVMLTDYDLSSNCYHGVVLSAHREASSEPVPYFKAVHGLRPYPQPGRGDRDIDFQWVEPGQDESPLINIAQANRPH